MDQLFFLRCGSTCAPLLGVPYSFWGSQLLPCGLNTRGTCNNVWRHLGLSQLGGTAGISWVEARDAAKHPTMQGTASITETFLGPDGNISPEAENPALGAQLTACLSVPFTLLLALASLQDVGHKFHPSLGPLQLLFPWPKHSAPPGVGSLSSFRCQRILPPQAPDPSHFH